MWRFLPNFITILRALATLPVLVLLLDQSWRPAFWLLLLAGLSDLLDGWLAKRFGWQSRLGAALDGLADKILLLGVFLGLVLVNQLPIGWLILVVSRDLIIVCGAWLYNRLIETLRPQPSGLGKLSTASQIALALWIIASSAWSLPQQPLAQGLFWLAVFMTSVSGLQYILVWALRARSHGLSRNIERSKK